MRIRREKIKGVAISKKDIQINKINRIEKEKTDRKEKKRNEIIMFTSINSRGAQQHKKNSKTKYISRENLIHTYL